MNTVTLQPAAIYAFGRASGWLFLALVFSAGAIFFVPLLIVPAVLFAATGGWRYLQLRLIRYELGSEELKVRTGVLWRRSDHLEWFRVKDYVEIQPLMLRIFGLIHLDLLSNDRSNPHMRLLAVQGENLSALIREHVQAARRKNPILEWE